MIKRIKSIIMLVVSLQVTAMLVMLNASWADSFRISATASGYCDYAGTFPDPWSDYQSNFTTALETITSEVTCDHSFYTHGVEGPWPLTGGNSSYPLPSAMSDITATSSTLITNAQAAQFSGRYGQGETYFIAESSHQLTVTAGGQYKTAEFDIIIDPIHLITLATTRGRAAPKASYLIYADAFLGHSGSPINEYLGRIFSSSAMLSGGPWDYHLIKNGEDPGGFFYTPIESNPDSTRDGNYIGYRFNGFSRHFNMGTMDPDEHVTFILTITLKAEAAGGGDIFIDEWGADQLCGAGAFIEPSLPAEISIGPTPPPPKVGGMAPILQLLLMN